MKKVKSICIFLYGCLFFATMGALSVELYKENVGNETENPMTADYTIPSVNTKEDKYIVVEEANQLVVYYVKNHVKYLATDISVDHLPTEVREKVKSGLSFQDEKSLYDFLENYSS